MATTLTVAVLFTENTGDPATGLTLADINVYLTAVAKDDGAETVIWDGTQNPTSEIDDMGAYIRIYDAANPEDFDYFARGEYTGATVLDVDNVMGATSGFNPWSYDTRTLTQSGVSVASAVSGSNITILRGDSLSASITGIGDISGRTMLWWTVKYSRDDVDADSIIQIEETDGLLILNRAVAGTPANGSITVTDAVAGDLTIALDEVETAQLIPSSLEYDIQMFDGTDITTLVDGDAIITADVTRTTS